MIRRIETVKDATREWVREFNAIDTDMINALMAMDFNEWEEVTMPSIGDRVSVYKVPDGCESTCDEGEIIGYNDKEGYIIEMDDDVVVELEKYDFDTVYNNCEDVLPMWGTMWSFSDPCDQHWIEEGNGIQVLSECGFRIYSSDRYGYFFGIDGAGYNFYEAHWIPLYLKRGLKWHEGPKWYAEVKWSIEDVISVASQQGVELTEEQTEKWWKENEFNFANSLIADGMERLLYEDFSQYSESEV